MDNQDKIFKKIKTAAHKSEEKDFPGMERIWQRVEIKLEQKELQTKKQTWKKIAIAALVVLFLSLGYQFFKLAGSNSANDEEKVVIQEKQTPNDIANPSAIKTPEVTTVPEIQIEKQNPLILPENGSVPTIASTETNAQAYNQKDEAIVMEEKNAAVAVGDSDRMNMKATSNAMASSDIEVVGYGTKKKSDLTNAVATVSSADIKKVVETAKTKNEKGIIFINKTGTFPSQIFDAIVVKSAYAKTEQKESFVTPKSVVETNGPLVVVNGKATNAQFKSVEEAKKALSKKLDDEELESLIVLKEPLYTINGVEYTEESLFGSQPTSPYAPLSKQNIETIEILQNEKAIEKYGEKGSKGVVIITTKIKFQIKNK